MAEFKTFMFSIFTLMLFFLITAPMPVSFYTAQDSYDPDIPAFYQGGDIVRYAFTVNFTLDDSTFSTVKLGYRSYEFTLGGNEFVMYIDAGYTNLRLGVKNYFTIFWISTDYMQFKHELGANRGDVLTSTEANNDYTEAESWVKYRMYNQRDPSVGCDIYLGFNDSLYASPSEALSEQSLTAFVGIGLDDIYTVNNAWTLIAQIMLFQLPDIHPILNSLIAFPLWFMFALPLALILLKFLPFVG